MPGHIQTIVAIVIVAAWGASPIGAQQPAHRCKGRGRITVEVRVARHYGAPDTMLAS